MVCRCKWRDSFVNHATCCEVGKLIWKLFGREKDLEDETFDPMSFRSFWRRSHADHFDRKSSKFINRSQLKILLFPGGWNILKEFRPFLVTQFSVPISGFDFESFNSLFKKRFSREFVWSRCKIKTYTSKFFLWQRCKPGGTNQIDCAVKKSLNWNRVRIKLHASWKIANEFSGAF